MTVLVTGGSGLLGSHVIEALRARGEGVRALARDRACDAVRALGAEPVPGDVTDPAAWTRAATGARAIVHAAALVTQRLPLEQYVDVNVGGTRLAAQTARRGGLRLVHVSSVAVYGRAAAPAAARAVDEDFPLQPLPDADFYARSKRMSETVLREAAGRGDLTAVAIRPNVIYGERDRLFTPKLLRFVRLGVVPLVGRGANHLSCVYAGNVAAAVVAALDAPVTGFRAYNVTRDAPPELTQREFLAAFGAALGTRVRALRIPVAAARLGVTAWTGWQRLLDSRGYAGVGRAAVAFMTDDNPYAADRAARELGWDAAFDARAAIERTVRWFVKRRGA